MTPLRWAQIKRVYSQAIEIGPGESEAYLAEACGSDEELRHEVESLLRDRTDASDLASPWNPIDWTGRTVGHFRVLNRIAGGGMGVVYRAEDSHLKRYVALKVVAPLLVADDSARERLLREARAAASIEHPNVCTVYEVGEFEGQTFVAMALIEGRSVSELVQSGRCETQEAIDIAIEIAEGLQAAHYKGIVHRDIKSANIMLDRAGRVKILDFGLARLPGELITRSGTLLGTPAYMSPEQAQGKAVDQRTDIWSLGVVLYEMVSRTRPFRADSEYGVIRSIVEDEPKPLSASRAALPAGLDRVIEKALAKNPDERYQRVEDLVADLRAIRQQTIPSGDSPQARPTFRRRWKQVAAIVAVLSVAAVGWQRWESSRRQWAFETALPEIERLDADGNRIAAFQLALQAEPYLQDDLRFEEIWPRISIALSIETTPPDATVSYRRPTATDAAWDSLGTSPIYQERMPAEYIHLQIEKTGFSMVERAVDLSESGRVRWGRQPTVRVEMRPASEIPSDMVLIPSGGSVLNRLFFVETPSMPLAADFLFDKYEVTNRDFLDFVEAGGYEEPHFWKHEFVKSEEVISWAQAMQQFRDATGRPGPAGWELGRYPEGQAEFPVGGVSWYEAAAYAEFVGKSLPTVHHWTHAVDAFSNHWLAPLGNFSHNGPRPVHGSLAMGPFGTYDAAGNVKEWCWNQPAEAGHKRFILGGGWDEAEYLFREPDTRDAFERLPTYGFRCVRYLNDQRSNEALLQPIRYRFRDYSIEEPVSDQQFEMFRRFYEYDPLPLDARIESASDHEPLWHKEIVSFRAAYGDQRVPAQLLLPKRSRPPYQTVVVFPAVDAVFRRTSDDLSSGYTGFFTSFLAKSGRAVVYPIYNEMYERGKTPPTPPAPTKAWRDLLITQYRDLARTIDYLETRKDIDQSRIAYFGLSLGAAISPVMLAVEQRLRTAVLCYGGFYAVRFLPEADPINFAPRVRLPILVINGRSDHAYPVQSSQLPFFHMLGTPEKQKRRVLRDGGHSLPQHDVIRETLAWLDEQLGPVDGH